MPMRAEMLDAVVKGDMSPISPPSSKCSPIMPTTVPNDEACEKA